VTNCAESSAPAAAQGAFQSAVDAYLSLDAGDVPNGRKLADAWHAAARLAATHLPAAAAAAAASAAARKLLAAREPRAAAALFVQAGDAAAAVRALCGAGLAADAAKVASGDPALEALAAQLGGGAHGSSGGAAGGSERELEEHARRGNWEQARRDAFDGRRAWPARK
jgi:hypothetical protein